MNASRLKSSSRARSTRLAYGCSDAHGAFRVVLAEDPALRQFCSHGRLQPARSGQAGGSKETKHGDEGIQEIVRHGAFLQLRDLQSNDGLCRARQFAVGDVTRFRARRQRSRMAFLP